MKRILAIFCILALTLPLFSCASTLSDTPGETAGETVKETEETKLDASKISYPKGFSVGYAREDVSPEETPIIINGVNSIANTINDPVQLTCTAMSDGETAFLLMSVDLRGVPESFVQRCKKIITDKVKIPAENIFLNATHTHHAPDNERFDEDAVIIRWQKMFYEKLEKAVITALLDLTPAKAFVGSSHTEGITFVRRFLLPDGTYSTNSTDPNAKHESEADTEMRVIRFDREGSKKDVLLVNYQTHYDSSKALDGKISANFVHTFRQQAEKALDAHFAYHQGAAGNLNFMSPVKGARLYANYKLATPALVNTVKDAIKGEKEVSTGKIKVAHNNYDATVWVPDEQRVADAEYVNSKKSEAEKKAARAEKGFASNYEVAGIITRSKLIKAGTTTVPMPFTAVSIGDIAFTAAPYEMFDTNGVEIRNASPFEMTFTCSYTNGHMGYIPSAQAFPHGAYEVFVCKYRPGSGEEFATEIVRLLNQCK